MSEHVTTQTAAPAVSPAQLTNGAVLQRKCACGSYGEGGECDKCRKKGNELQRKEDGSGGPGELPASVHQALSSSGQPLDSSVRRWIEPRFNRDFSNVRVHTDGPAAQSARDVNALAYTVGADVVFAQGKYSPETEAGSRLLAHELTHVVQQQQGSVSAQGKTVSEPSDAAEREADSVAEKIMTGESISIASAPSAAIHAELSDGEKAAVVGSIAGAIGIGFGIAYLAGAFDKETFSDTELRGYLTTLATTRRREGHRDSDNKARDVVRHWQAGEAAFNINAGFSATGGSLTGNQLKRLLIQEMLDGVTGGADEVSILTILENSSTSDLLDLLDPTQGLAIQDIDKKVDGDNHDRFERLLEARFPRGGPSPAPQRDQTGPTCTGRQSVMVDFARRRALDEVNNTIAILTSRTNEPAVRRVIDCRFPGASAAQINEIRGVFQRVLTRLPQRIYHCAGEGGAAELEGMVARDSEGNTRTIDCLSEYAVTFGFKAGTGRAGTINEVFLCPEFFRQSPEGQVITIVHESVHAAGLLQDPKYQPPCGLNLGTSLINPDSYAYLASDLMSIPASGASGNAEQVQRKATSTAPATLPSVVDDALVSSGESLDETTRRRMELQFNHDFDTVRVHTGPTATASARAVNAVAYTVGDDIVFNDGQYDPSSSIGTRLLAHELTHVVQQSSDRNQVPQPAKPFSEPSDPAELEADVASDKISRGEPVQVEKAPNAQLHAMNPGETAGVVAGVVGGAAAIGVGIAALVGAFDTSKFRDCGDEWQKKINPATETAQAWISNAITKVDAVISGGNKQGDQFVIDKLWEHFKITPAAKKELNTLRSGLAEIQAGFSSVEFECEEGCDETETSGELGYVSGLFGLGLFPRFGRIHLCRFWLKQDAQTQAETIAHEMGHRFAGKRGDVRRREKPHDYSALTTDQALENADSYAQFAKVIFNIGSMKSSEGSTEGATETGKVNRKAISDDEASAVPSQVHDVLQDSGEALDSATREWMEPRFARDFSDVRVHTGAQAADSARSINAAAYTVGHDVVFGPDRYEPGTSQGKTLLAHELTHVVQQSGEVASHDLQIDEDPGAEQQADQVSQQVVQGHSVQNSLQSPSSTPGGLHRQAEDDLGPEPEERIQPPQSGGIPVVNPGRGMGGNPPPPGCVEFLWAREYERIFRLDTISVLAIGAVSAGDSKQEVRDARQKNRAAQIGVSELCEKYVDVKHPFSIRFYYSDVDIRTSPGDKIETDDAKKNRALGQTLGAGLVPKLLVYVERELAWQEDFGTDTKAFDEKLKSLIKSASTSGAKKGRNIGMIVGGALGLLTGVGVGLAAGFALAAGGMAGGAAAGLGVLAGLGAGGAVFGASTGIGALIGHAAGKDRGTEALSDERIKAVKNWMNYARSKGEVKEGLEGSEADDLARDAITLWIDKPDEMPLTVQDRRLLIRIMLDGPTLDDDERSIIKLFENSTDAEVLEILDTTVDKKHRVILQDLDANIHGEEWKQFRKMLAARYPTLGAPEIERSDKPSDTSCEADRTIMIMEARKRATSIIPIALQRLSDYESDPKGNKDVLDQMQCYFPNVTAADIARIKSVLTTVQRQMSSRKFVCAPANKQLQIPTPKGPATNECASNEPAYSVTWPGDQQWEARQETFVCPLFFENGPDTQTMTIIHEWIHQAIPQSEIDEYDPKCGKLAKDTALGNPDSYTYLAFNLASGHAAANAGAPSVSIGNFRNSGSPTPENRCVSCTQIPTLGVDPGSGENFMELTGEIVGHQPGALYDFKRTKEVAIWMETQGSWQRAKYDPPGSLDDASADDEDTAPKNNRIYSIDGPGLHAPLPSVGDPSIDGGVYKGNFIETVNVKVGDGPWTPGSNNFLWHSITWFERGSDGVLKRTPSNNEIEPGHISIGPAALPFGPGDYNVPIYEDGVPA